MANKIIVHTGAPPGSALPEEREALDVPGIDFVLRGVCNTPDQVLKAVRDAHAALCRAEPYTRQVFAGAPHLQVVVRYGVGVDTIDLDAATEFGVIVANFPDFCIEEVANHALLLLLSCAKKVLRLDHAMREKGWVSAQSLFSPMGTIHGETLGLVAFGNISRALAKRARALKMQVVAYDPFVEPQVYDAAGVSSVALMELARRSDYVSCHPPLTEQTRGMIDASFFAHMKPSAYFINPSRGAVVKESDLIAALRDGSIAGAGLDVYESEPIDQSHPFCAMDNVILTPHSASYADATFSSLRRRVAQSALAVVKGELPEFVANPEVLARRRK